MRCEGYDVEDAMWNGNGAAGWEGEHGRTVVESDTDVHDFAEACAV